MKVRKFKQRAQPTRSSFDFHAYMRSVYKDRYGWLARARTAVLRARMSRRSSSFPTVSSMRRYSLLDLGNPSWERDYQTYSALIGRRLQVER